MIGDKVAGNLPSVESLNLYLMTWERGRGVCGRDDRYYYYGSTIGISNLLSLSLSNF